MSDSIFLSTRRTKVKRHNCAILFGRDLSNKSDLLTQQHTKPKHLEVAGSSHAWTESELNRLWTLGRCRRLLKRCCKPRQETGLGIWGRWSIWSLNSEWNITLCSEAAEADKRCARPQVTPVETAAAPLRKATASAKQQQQQLWPAFSSAAHSVSFKSMLVHARKGGRNHLRSVIMPPLS